jgi:hypothetical protein
MGIGASDARVAQIHELARQALEAGAKSESEARLWLVGRDARLRHDRYFQHVFFDVFGMQLTYRRLRKGLAQ